MTRGRLRDLGITIGSLPTGHHNAISDVPGVWVGHSTLIYDEPRIARTGVTVIRPREGGIWHDNAFAGVYSFNGNGELTGAHWIEESGLLSSSIALTNTYQVGVVRDALIAYHMDQGHAHASALPVVCETYDGRLNDIGAFHITQAHAYEALNAAKAGPVEEGNIGGGTGMICHGFKGGIGTSSRLVDDENGQYTVGALVQANYGNRGQLRVAGIPVGREIGPDHSPLPCEGPQGGSIIVIIATDAPLLPVQCKRLARRGTVGLVRVGGAEQGSSGDIFLAFATGNHISPPRWRRESATGPSRMHHLTMLPHCNLNPFFRAVGEAVEEAILNALTSAQTMTGFRGCTAYALPLEDLQRIMAK